jgi:hypothetical protein
MPVDSFACGAAVWIRSGVGRRFCGAAGFRAAFSQTRFGAATVRERYHARTLSIAAYKHAHLLTLLGHHILDRS